MIDNAMSLNERIKKARAKFAAMAGTYFVGVFNDNFFKQTALLMAVIAGKENIQGHATIVFTLPFIVLAAHAGWFADKFSKRSVVIGAKALELAAMIFGAWGIITGNWILILVMLGIEGVQAAIFSPALNGSIPELYPAQYVITANAIIRMLSTAAILIGIAAGGFVLDIKGDIGYLPFNRVAAAALVITVSLAGVIMSFGVARFPAAAPAAKFPWQGPIETLKVLYKTRFDASLAAAIAANAFFWFVGSLNVLMVNKLGISQLKLSNSMTSALVVAELVGIAAGGLLSIYLSKKIRWHRILAPAAFVMALCMIAVAAVPFFYTPVKLLCLFGALGIMGLAGGLYVIPLEAFIQVRPAPDSKGKTIAAANFAAFTGILLSGPTLNLLNYLEISSSGSFAVLGAMTLIVAIFLLAFPREKQNA